MAVPLQLNLVIGENRLNLNDGVNYRLSAEFVRRVVSQIPKKTYNNVEESYLLQILGGQSYSYTRVQQNLSTLIARLDQINRANSDFEHPLLLEVAISGAMPSGNTQNNVWCSRLHSANLVLPDGDLNYVALNGMPGVQLDVTRGPWINSRTYAGFGITGNAYQNSPSQVRRLSDSFVCSGLLASENPSYVSLAVSISGITSINLDDRDNSFGYIIASSKPQHIIMIPNPLNVTTGIEIADTTASGGRFWRSDSGLLRVNSWRFSLTTFSGVATQYEVFAKLRCEGTWSATLGTTESVISETPDPVWKHVATLNYSIPPTIGTLVTTGLTVTSDGPGNFDLESIAFIGVDSRYTSIMKPTVTVPASAFTLGIRHTPLGPYYATPSDSLYCQTLVGAYPYRHTTLSGIYTQNADVVYEYVGDSVFLYDPRARAVHVTTLINGSSAFWAPSGIVSTSSVNAGITDVSPIIPAF